MRRVSATHRFKFEVPISQVVQGTNAFSGVLTAVGFDDVIAFAIPAGITINYASYAWVFQLFDLTAAQQNLILQFDRYMIGPIIAHFTPVGNVSLVGPQSGVGYGGMSAEYALAYDHDDYAATGANLASWNQFRSRPGCKKRNGVRSCRYQVKPTNLAPIVDTNAATVSSARSMRSGWIDSAYTKPLHYGLKAMFQFFNPSTIVTEWAIRGRLTYYIRGQTCLV